MTLTRNSIAALVLFIGLAFSLLPAFAHAAPSSFCTDGMTTATTSPVFMTPGTATTTITTSNCADASYKLNGLAFLLQLTGSSTGAIFQGKIQDSADGIDWYDRAPNESASTTPTFALAGTAATFTKQFASTTPDGTGVTNANSAVNRSVLLITPLLRFTRVQMSLPIGSTNGAVWAKFIGWREALGGGR